MYTLGALLLTCKQLHACVAGAQLTRRLADAAQGLCSAHPLFSAPSALQYLEQQEHTAAAIAARDSWTWRQLAERDLSSISPDGTKLASCIGVRLDILGLQPDDASACTSVPLDCPAIERHLCKWSHDSNVVAWQGSPSTDSEGRSHRLVSLYKLSTGELQTAVLEQGGDSCRLPNTRFLPDNSFLTFVGEPGYAGRVHLSYHGERSTRFDRRAHHPCVVSLGANGLLHTDISPSGICVGSSETFRLAVSGSGCLAFCGDSHASVCVWQPGVQHHLFQSTYSARSLCWRPDSRVILANQWGSVAFYDLSGAMLAEQELVLNTAMYWVPQGVLSKGGYEADHDFYFYAVLQGPLLELPVRWRIPRHSRPYSYLSPSSEHFAFVLGRTAHEYDDGCMEEPRELYVIATPRARTAGSGVEVYQLPQVPTSTELGLGMLHSIVRWLSNGCGLLVQLGMEVDPITLSCERTVLVRFM